MHFLVTALLCLSFSLTTFAVEPKHSRTKPQEAKKDDGKRPQAPKVVEAGFNGFITEGKAGTFVVNMPSGQRMTAFSDDAKIKKQLEEIAKKDDIAVEVDGEIVDGKLKIKSIETETRAYNGYVIDIKNANDNDKILDWLQKDQRAMTLRKAQDGVWAYVTTDLSAAAIKRAFKDAGLGASIGKVERMIEGAYGRRAR